MTELMIISGLILIICITSTKLLYKFGVPMLLIFIVLGMLFGSDGIIGIPFDNYELANQLCSIGLVFIMFYGGFGTNWKVAKPVAVPSILMSSLGVIIIAGLTWLFCHFALKMTLLEGILVGTIIASTDAASVVFAIMAVTYGVNIENDIFHIIFFIALFSVSIQGTLIPKLANLLDLVDTEDQSAVLKTFNDYTGEINTDLLEVNITQDSKWINKTIMDANIPEEILIVMIKRNNSILVPKGSTTIKEGDILVLSGNNIKSLIA